MSNPGKQIVYRYNDNDAENEDELDLDGEIDCMTGNIIQRNGKSWKVEDTLLQDSNSPTELPILTISLTDKF